MTALHTDTYSLAGPRSCVLTYPPDLSAEELDGVTNWLQLIVWKLGRIATPAATLDALRRNELADTDARCDRLKSEKGELQTELAHQRKLVDTLTARVEAMRDERSAKPKAAAELDPLDALKKINAGLDAMIQSAKPPAPKVIVTDDPEADLTEKVTITDLPEFFVEQSPDLPAVLPVPDAPYPSVPAVVEEPTCFEVAAALSKKLEAAPANTRKRINRGRETRIKIAAALVPKPLTMTEIHAATGIPQGTLSGVLCMPVLGWWTKRFHHKGSPYELTDAGRAALRAAGIDAPDPPAPKGIDVHRERCKLVAEEMVKLVAPQAPVVLAAAAGLEWGDVERYLRTHPEWFARVEGGGDYYRLTQAGRELANEQEVA